MEDDPTQRFLSASIVYEEFIMNRLLSILAITTLFLSEPLLAQGQPPPGQTGDGGGTIAALEEAVSELEASVAAQQDEINALEISLTENVPFIGTYFVRNDANDPASTTLMDLHSDGTITNNLANMFCFKDVNCRPQAPAHGKWKKTTDNEVSVVLFVLATNDLTWGEFANGGTIFKLTWVQTFDVLVDGVYQEFSVVEFDAKLYAPNGNPFGEPFFALTVTNSPFSGRRINME